MVSRTRKKSYKPRRRTPRYREISNIVPDSKIVRHRYVQQIVLNASTGLNAVALFRANSIFDPDFLVGGHQPLGYDQWSVFYDHYVVIGSKINVKFISASTSGTLGSAMCGILLKDNSAQLVEPQNIMEQSNSNYRLMTNQNAGGAVSVSATYSPKKFFGIKDISDNRSLLGSSINSNPSEEAYYHVYAAPLAAGIDAAPLSAIVTIQYTVMYSERKSLSTS